MTTTSTPETQHQSRPRLAVITHTRDAANPGPYMAETLRSLEYSMPEVEAQHFVIECSDRRDYERMRWEARLLGDYFCFVDDDDLVVNDSIRKCMAVFETNPNVGAVFTKQELIDEKGQVIPRADLIGELTYAKIAYAPQVMHHLTIVRSKAVHPRCFDVTSALDDRGIDWMMKASAALSFGAIHVPIVGYQWRQRQASVSRDFGWQKRFNAIAPNLRSFLTASAVGPKGRVPLSTE